jgi:hypothetical protein
MNQLVPCPSCARHVRQSESACPFCSVELALGNVSPAALPRVRLGRAATFAFGASLVGAASLVACGGESETGKPNGGGASGMAGSTSVSGAGGNSVGGNATAGAGGNSAGTFNGMGGNIAQPYGVPPLGGYGPVYGAPPEGGASSGGAGGTSNGGAGGKSSGGTGGNSGGGTGGTSSGGTSAAGGFGGTSAAGGFSSTGGGGGANTGTGANGGNGGPFPVYGAPPQQQ